MYGNKVWSSTHLVVGQVWMVCLSCTFVYLGEVNSLSMSESLDPVALVLVALPPAHEAVPVGLLPLEAALVGHPLELVVAGELEAALALGLVVLVHLALIGALGVLDADFRHDSSWQPYMKKTLSR